MKLSFLMLDKSTQSATLHSTQTVKDLVNHIVALEKQPIRLKFKGSFLSNGEVLGDIERNNEKLHDGAVLVVQKQYQLSDTAQAKRRITLHQCKRSRVHQQLNAVATGVADIQRNTACLPELASAVDNVRKTLRGDVELPCERQSKQARLAEVRMAQRALQNEANALSTAIKTKSDSSAMDVYNEAIFAAEQLQEENAAEKNLRRQIKEAAKNELLQAKEAAKKNIADKMAQIKVAKDSLKQAEFDVKKLSLAVRKASPDMKKETSYSLAHASEKMDDCKHELSMREYELAQLRASKPKAKGKAKAVASNQTTLSTSSADMGASTAAAAAAAVREGEDVE